MVDDFGHRILVFDKAGEFLRVLGSEGNAPGQLLWPDAIHWDRWGHLYVADTGSHRIQVWDGDGRYLRSFGGTTQISSYVPSSSVALLILALFCALSIIWRLATGNWRDGAAASVMIVALTITGWLLLSFGRSSHSLRNPRDVWVTGDDFVYVTDFGGHRVRVYDSRGAIVGTFGHRGSNHGEFLRPVGLAVSPQGSVYVVDSGNDRLQVFTSEGTFIRQMGGPGQLPGEFSSPHSVALGPDNVVYVSDRGNRRVQVLKADGTTVQILGRWDLGLEHDPVPAGLCWRDGQLLIVDTASRRVVVWPK